MITCRWFYQNYDIRDRFSHHRQQVPGILQNENQLYWSFHKDANPISVVLGKVTVHWIKSGLVTQRVSKILHSD